MAAAGSPSGQQGRKAGQGARAEAANANRRHSQGSVGHGIDNQVLAALAASSQTTAVATPQPASEQDLAGSQESAGTACDESGLAGGPTLPTPGDKTAATDAPTGSLRREAAANDEDGGDTEMAAGDGAIEGGSLQQGDAAMDMDLPAPPPLGAENSSANGARRSGRGRRRRWSTTLNHFNND